MRAGVCVGVAGHAEPARLAATVSFLRAHTDPGVRLVLLPDGPDEPTATALTGDAELAAIEQWATPEPRGMAACFNRLASRSPAGVVVLAIVHHGNTVPKTVGRANWSRASAKEIEQLLGPVLDFYRDHVGTSRTSP